MAEVSTITQENIMTAEMAGLINGAYDYWANKTLDDVRSEMPEQQIVELQDGRQIPMIEIAPGYNDHDISTDIVLPQPYLNGYSEGQYIRAKTLQLVVNPNASVWMLPNTTNEGMAYKFTPEEKTRLAGGDFRPLGEIQIAAFERLKSRVGALSITGYSQGGLSGLAMAAVGSYELHIATVNADETPSKLYRNAKQLQKDFRVSSPLGDLFGAVKDADIDALTEDKAFKRLAKDIALFGLASMKRDAKLLNQAMTGSADTLVEAAIQNDVGIKLGYVAGSTLFDPESVAKQPVIVEEYSGAPFNRRHATGDNVIAHAVMASRGMYRSL